MDITLDPDSAISAGSSLRWQIETATLKADEDEDEMEREDAFSAADKPVHLMVTAAAGMHGLQDFQG